MNTIIIPTTNNFPMLVRCLEAIRDLTREAEYRINVFDNGSTDETPRYLQSLVDQNVPITNIRNETNLGFVKATNAGTKYAVPGSNICWMNDDVQVTDPLWLYKLECDLQDPAVGMVVPVSNYVMWLQRFDQSYQLPVKHFTNVVVYFVGLMRWDVFEKVGYLDERFGVGGNDDMDYSIRIRDAGYQLLVDRSVFCYHYGSQTLLREGDTNRYEEINTKTRALLVEKWGQARVDELFTLTPDLVAWQHRNDVVTTEERLEPETFGRSYFETTTVRPYRRDALWLSYFYRRAAAIMFAFGLQQSATVLDAGCAMFMEGEALRMMGINAWGIDFSQYALSQVREDMCPYVKQGSISNLYDMPDSDITKYDLVICIEVLEHLHKETSEKALQNLCLFTDQILFSSTPHDKTEPTHFNVQEPAYWHLLFAQQGFMPDTTFDARFVTDWATLYRRTTHAN